MMYSVWDQASRTYRYFQTPEGSSATSSPKPAHLRASTLGLTPEEAAWPLPTNAKFVGVGKYPKGHIAIKKSGGMPLGFLPDFTVDNLLVYGALGFLAWKFLLEPRLKS